MAGIIKRNPKAFIMAVALHLGLIFFLLVGVDWLKDPEAGRPKVEVVKATVIDESMIRAEAEKLKKEKQQAKARQLAEKTKAQKELEQLKKQQADLKKKQKAEKKRLADLEKKRKTEAKKRAIEKKKRAEAERKRKAAEAKRKKTEAKKKAEAKKRAEADKRRKAAEARKRRQEEAARKRREQLQESLKAEQNERALRRFVSALGAKVTSNWRRPPGTGAGFKCKLRVRVASNGTVLGVQVVQSSGNSAFDRSAEAAVFKSDPLPAPPAGVRDITFLFDPDRS